MAARRNDYRIVPDGKPFMKGERAWYKLDGQEHWLLFESLADFNQTIPSKDHFVWKEIKEREDNQ